MSAVPSIGRAAEVEPAAPALGVDTARVLYERHYSRLLGFCLNRLGSREAAEDAVQTTFLNAFRGLQRGVVPQFESAWLFKIAENVCHAHHRSERRRGRVETTRDLAALDEVLPAPLRADDELVGLAEALTQIPATQRRAILLREWRGLSYREIAEELGLSNAAVETLIFRARRSLAQKLERPVAFTRRRASSVNAASLLASLKSAFGGGAALKLAAAAVALTGAAVATQAPLRHELERIAGFGAPPARIGGARSPAQAANGLPYALVFPQLQTSGGRSLPLGDEPFVPPLPLGGGVGGEAALPGSGSQTFPAPAPPDDRNRLAPGPLGQDLPATGASRSEPLGAVHVGPPATPSVSVPTVPSVPPVPSAPAPAAPSLPKVPSVPVTPPSADAPAPPPTPSVPQVPSAPSVPQAPAITTPALPALP